MFLFFPQHPACIYTLLLSLSNTPHIAPIVPPIIAHPGSSRIGDGFLHVGHECLGFCLLFDGLRREEFGFDDVEPKGGFDGDHEAQAGVDGVADCGAGVANLLEEVEGGKGWVFREWVGLRR
jgi:hypothetical protein